MNVKTQIQQDIIKAMKAKDSPKLDFLRYIISQINDEEINQARKELTDDQIIKLISGQLKKLDDSINLFKQGKREDLVKKTEAEINILKCYLPTQLSVNDLEKEISIIIEQNKHITQPGPLIGIASKALAGKADNKQIALLVLKKFKK